MTPIQLWGGIECTINRVGDCYFDQRCRYGDAARRAEIDLAAAVGVSALRYPLLWERMAPSSVEDIDWGGSDEPLARIRERGLLPIVGLVHHGSGPAYTSLVDEAFPELLARYARRVAERYPWVTHWTPVNEPLTTARFSALYGHWHPHVRDARVFVRAVLAQLRGVVLAMQQIRAVNPFARLIQTEDLGRPSGTPAVRSQVTHERHRRWLTWDLLSGRVDAFHPMRPFLRRAGASDADLAFFQKHPCPPDVIGINYYLTSDRWLDHRQERYPAWAHGGNGRLAYSDVEVVRARRRGIVGHEQHLVDTWNRYRRPVALTEVHLSCTREEQLRWFVEAWDAAHGARARGADVCAVTAWALLGSYDWNSLVTREAGHYEPGLFDVRAPTPRPTALAALVRDLAAGRAYEHPVVRVPGWWRRADRLTFGPASADGRRRVLEGPPMLILGVRGTLGRAFERVCAQRGLPVHVVGRADMDISDPVSVDATLRRVRPWAVINTAGYVRVDAAEADHAACWRDNVVGPVTLAAACRRRRLPLVTFSSDLVFDGKRTRPYVESDPPAPLNVYGVAKAEAERRVLELLPDALVVRTSAFFGPCDDHNFATRARRAVAAGTCFAAADDCLVSPTYVPDLVNATLDLLIDGEGGLWHLANDGAATWYEFARMVTAEAGLPQDLVRPCRWRDLRHPARRPPYSVLGSERAWIMPPLDAAVKAYVREAAVMEVDEGSRCVSS